MNIDLLAYLRAVLDDRNLDLPDENLESVAATYVKLRHEFEKLMSVDLRFLPPYIEPETAIRWIESYAEDQVDPR